MTLFMNQQQQTDDVLSSSDTSTDISSLSAGIASSDTPLHTIILDCSMFGFVDMVGLKTLHSIVDHCTKKDIHVVFASCKGKTKQTVKIIFNTMVFPSLFS